jgi:hypothetical protein
MWLKPLRRLPTMPLTACSWVAMVVTMMMDGKHRHQQQRQHQHKRQM